MEYVTEFLELFSLVLVWSAPGLGILAGATWLLVNLNARNWR